MAGAGPSHVHASGGEEPIEEMWVSTRVLAQFGIIAGDQIEVLVAFMQKEQNVHDPFVTTNVCLRNKLGNYHFRIAKDDEPDGTKGFIFYIKVDSSEDVNKLNGHMWKFWSEFVDFRRIKKLYVRDWEDYIDTMGCLREVF
ncbi:unnamed protein product [Urochloa humidicola]